MTEKIYDSFYCTFNTRISVKEQDLLLHLHFEEKKCGEGSRNVRKASLGGVFGGWEKGNDMVGKDKKCFGGRGK